MLLLPVPIVTSASPSGPGLADGGTDAAMTDDSDLRAQFDAAVRGAGSAQAVAARLCEACVALLDVDGAWLSLLLDATPQGTVGAHGGLSRHLADLQFTFGEGPCVDAARHGRPVLVADLDDPADDHWPAFSDAALQAGASAVFAMPVRVAASRVGALALYRTRRGRLPDQVLAGALLAADLASLPLLDLLTPAALTAPTTGATADRGGDEDQQDPQEPDDDVWRQLAALNRTEVHQATGMIMDACDDGPAEALVRLRAYAYPRGRTAAQVAAQIVARQVSLLTSDWQDSPAPGPRR